MREERIEWVGGKRRGLNWWEEKRIELEGRKRRGLNWWEISLLQKTTLVFGGNTEEKEKKKEEEEKREKIQRVEFIGGGRRGRGKRRGREVEVGGLGKA